MNSIINFNRNKLFLLSISLFLWSIFFFTLGIFKNNYLYDLFLLAFILIYSINFSMNDFTIELKGHKVIKSIDIIIICCIVLFLFLLNFKFLNASLAFHGDEQYHFYRSKKFIDSIIIYLKNNKNMIFIIPNLFLISLFFFLILFSKIIKNGTAIIIIISSAFAFFAVSLFLSFYSNTHFISARYSPFIAFVQGLLFRINPLTKFLELTSRLLSFIPLILIGIFFYFYLLIIDTKRIFAVLFSIILMTLPLMIYHYSILYIDPVMILLQSCAVLIILNCINKKEYFNYRSTIAFIVGLTGFIKETTIPFITASFIILSLIEMFENKGDALIKKLLRIISFFIMIYLPIIFTFLIRTSFNEENVVADYYGYKQIIINIVNIKFYSNYFNALINQFNLCILPIIFFSIIYSIVRRKFIYENIFASLIIIFIMLFYSSVTDEFNGYSRFNLGFIPSIIIYFVIFVKILTIQETD